MEKIEARRPGKKTVPIISPIQTSAMRDLDDKLRARSVRQEREERCKLGLLCPNCCPPSPRLPIDVLTMDLIKRGHLRAISMCPFDAVELALSYPLSDRVGTRRVTDAG